MKPYTDDSIAISQLESLQIYHGGKLFLQGINFAKLSLDISERCWEYFASQTFTRIELRACEFDVSSFSLFLQSCLRMHTIELLLVRVRLTQKEIEANKTVIGLIAANLNSDSHILRLSLSSTKLSSCHELAELAQLLKEKVPNLESLNIENTEFYYAPLDEFQQFCKILGKSRLKKLNLSGNILAKDDTMNQRIDSLKAAFLESASLHSLNINYNNFYEAFLSEEDFKFFLLELIRSKSWEDLSLVDIHLEYILGENFELYENLKQILDAINRCPITSLVLAGNYLGMGYDDKLTDNMQRVLTIVEDFFKQNSTLRLFDLSSTCLKIEATSRLLQIASCRHDDGIVLKLDPVPSGDQDDLKITPACKLTL